MARRCQIAVLALLSATFSPAASRLSGRFYYLDDTMAATSLESHAADIEALLPVWLTVETTGALTVAIDPKLVSWAAARKIALIPVLANRDFKPEAAQAALADGTREKLIQTLARIAAENHFGGYELDFEEIPAPLRNMYTAFAGALAGALHKQNMVLGIAVPAPLTPGSGPDVNHPVWIDNVRAAPFDYTELARSADSLTLMAYDEYTAPEVPGPVAGIAWVEACIRKTLEMAPAQKLLLGLALYYRHWNGAKVTEGPLPVAKALAAKSSASVSMNATHQEMTFGFADSGVRHIVWGEDAASVAARVALADKYGLQGWAAWRIGQEDPEVWPRIFHRGREGK